MVAPFFFGSLYTFIVGKNKKTIEAVVREANFRLINGTFGKKEGEAFRKTLKEQLDNLPDKPEMKMFLFGQLQSCSQLNYQSNDEPTYLGIIRYIFSALSLLDIISRFEDYEAGKPGVRIDTPFCELFDKTVLELTKKIKATTLISQQRATMKEFHGIALEAYKKGFDAAAFFISTQTNEFVFNCGDTVLIHENPVAADLHILSTKSLDIAKHADIVLSYSNYQPLNCGQLLPPNQQAQMLQLQAEAYQKHAYIVLYNSKRDLNCVQLLTPNQQAQMLQLQAKAYHVKSIYSLAIQRGKEARDMYQNEIDKEIMKRFIEQMEIEQQKKKKDVKPESKVKVTVEEYNEQDSGDGSYRNEENKIDVLDRHMEPIITESEENIMKGTFDAPTAQHFHNDLRKYITDREQREVELVLPKGTKVLLLRVLQGLQIMIKNLSEDDNVWFGLLRYLFHVISLNDSLCKVSELSTLEPDFCMRPDFSEIYKKCISKIDLYLKRMTIEEVTVYYEELMDIARQAAKYGHKISCLFMTNAIIGLHFENLSLNETLEGSPIVHEIRILHLGSVDISEFTDYVIQVCMMGLTFSNITRKQKGMLYEYYSQALKHKKRYEQAIQKAQEAKASFQDAVDKNRIDELIHELESLDLLFRR